MIYFLVSVFILFLISIQIRFNLFAPFIKGLPILMYHKVSEHYESNTSTLVETLEKQFQYFVAQKYQCIRLSEILEPGFIYPRKPLLLTFDDGYLNNYELLIPLLIKYKLRVAIMLPVAYIGKTSEWEPETPLQLMDFQHIKKIDNQVIEFGLHSFAHRNYKSMTIDEVGIDIADCIKTLKSHSINFLPVLAYKFGGYPRESQSKLIFFNILRSNGIKIGLRIGNKINKLPLKEPFEIKRIDIRGTDSYWAFKTKLRKGRVKMFS